MRVVHLASEVGGGGAARSALNLHLGLLRLGVDSTMLVGEVYGETPKGVIRVPEMTDPKHEFALETQLLVWGNRSNFSNTHYSLNIPGWDPSSHSLIREADVIHLHWVAECLSASSISALSSLNKIVVWTLHDMRPLTGGCHFPAGCIGFRGDCSSCPQLLDDLGGMPHNTKRIMEKSIMNADLHFVAPSSWMMERAKKSTGRGNHEVTFIPYGVDLGHFTPGDRAGARKELALKTEPFYILIAAHDPREKRKGFTEAASILGRLKEEISLVSMISEGMIRILICGHKHNELKFPGYQIDYTGHLDYQRMPSVYRAADLLLFTSLEDNMPNVVMEALSCGLPLISHDLGGVMDLTGDDGGCGYVFPIGNIELATKKMLKIIQEKMLRLQMGACARKRMEAGYSLKDQAIHYVDFYRSIKSNHEKSHEKNVVTRADEYKVLLNSLLNSKDLKKKWLRKSLERPFYLIKRIYKACTTAKSKRNNNK